MIPQTSAWILGAGARDAVSYIRQCDSPAKLRTLRTYERKNARRAGILKAIDIRLRKLAKLETQS